MVDPTRDRSPDAGTAIVVAVMIFVFTVNAIILWRSLGSSSLKPDGTT